MVTEELLVKNLFNLEETLAKPLLEQCEYPWDAITNIGSFIEQIGKNLPSSSYEEKGAHIWIAKSSKIYPTAYIEGPCIIGERTIVRPGAFIRGNALVGNDCVVGNSTELKNVILFNHVQVPHYNYVGDSILGFHSHMGAGAITSNVKADQTLVTIKGDGTRFQTELKKLGAILGDYVEIGCNSVLNPGTVICKNTNVYPLSCVRGVILENRIYKNQDTIVEKY